MKLRKYEVYIMSSELNKKLEEYQASGDSISNLIQMALEDYLSITPLKCAYCGREKKGENANIGFRYKQDGKIICFDCDFDEMRKNRKHKEQKK